MIEHDRTHICDFEQTHAVAVKAIELAEKHRTPLVPKTYEVWFSYIVGKEKSVVERVNAIIDGGAPIRPYELEQIYDDCLDPARRDGDRLKSANARLDREMDDILSMIDGHLESSASYSGSLDKGVSGLSENASPDKIKRTIEFLLVENKKMRRETEKLSGNLERSKDQIQNLRSSLEKSRKNEMLDALTQIPNRRHLEVFLADHLEMVGKNGDTLSFVLADIDHFKSVNDAFGHLIGDEVLKYFASLLSKHVRGSDLPARYGGEEFALVLLNTDARTSFTIVDRIRSEMAKAKLMVTESKEPLGTITASFGIAEYCVGDDWVSLVKRADANLYAAKDAGRNCVVTGEEAAA